MPIRFLVAESEPPEARERRRESVGRSSGETFVDLLGRLVPGATIHRAKPADAAAELRSGSDLASYDAVFLTGSPLHLYEDSPEVRREVAFARAVFDAGTPMFGSCAGLQVATVAAGGSVRAMGARREAGFARRITPTAAGAAHPLLAGRPHAYDAPAIHTDEVETLPPGATLLASNAVTHVQAAEIRFGEGIFWGVQYHPELSLREVAAALRRQADDIVEHGLARTASEIEAVAQPLDALHDDPARRDLAWRLGLDAQVTEASRRHVEIDNFVTHLVRPTIATRR